MDDFNAAVAPGEFNPAVLDGKGTRGVVPPKSNWALPLDTPPFVGYAVTCGITFTFGGLRVTPRAEVLDTEDRPIPGLHAAGELVGGLFYENYPGGTGLMAGAVFGRLAGEQAARLRGPGALTGRRPTRRTTVELGISGTGRAGDGGFEGHRPGGGRRARGEGCRVAIAARGAEALRETAEALGAKGAEVLTVAADLAEPDAPRRVVDAVVARFGRLEILVNNAGAIRGGDFLTTPAEQWADDWRLKILGYVRMAQAAIPAMRTGRWGRIVNVIGAAARNPATTYMAGGIANAGLINFTRALADLGAPDGILVNAVSPGATATERWDRLAAQQAQAQGKSVEAFRAEAARQQPLGRIGRPEDVADLVAVPRLRAGRLPHGASITVDGGASRGVYL